MQNLVSSLDVIDVATPCPADWNEMTGDDRVRYCSQCNLNVYNLSDMSEGDVLQLVSEREDRLCVRFYRRVDGTMLTRDCPVGIRALRKKVATMWAKTAAMFGAMTWASLFGRAIEASEPEFVVEPPVIEAVTGLMAVQGDIAIRPDPPIQAISPPEAVANAMPPERIVELIKASWQRSQTNAIGQPDPKDTKAMSESSRQEVEDWLSSPARQCPEKDSLKHKQLVRYLMELTKRDPIVLLALQPQIRNRPILGRVKVHK